MSSDPQQPQSVSTPPFADVSGFRSWQISLWPALAIALMVGAIVVGAWLRVAHVHHTWAEPVQPDVQGVFEALQRPWSEFFAASPREPMFVYGLKLHYQIAGLSLDEIRHCRLATIPWGVAAIVAVGWVVLSAFRSLWLAAFAGWVMALEPHWIEVAGSGLRDAMTVPLMLVALGCWIGRRRVGFWRVMLGVSAGFLAVHTRAEFLPLLVATLGWTAFCGHMRVRVAVVAGTILVLSALPYRLNHSTLPSHERDMHARWFRNFEFVDTPGHLTYEKFLQNSMGGTPTTMREYLIDMHAPEVLAKEWLYGAHRAVFQWSYLKFLLLPGLFLLAFSVRRRAWAGMYLALILPYGWAFFLASGETRLFGPAFAVGLVACCQTLATLALMFQRRKKWHEWLQAWGRRWSER